MICLLHCGTFLANYMSLESRLTLNPTGARTVAGTPEYSGEEIPT